MTASHTSRISLSRPEEADVVRFDGSDLMAVAVGTGTFWQGMIDYVAGTDLDSVLINIQRGYGPLPP